MPERPSERPLSQQSVLASIQARTGSVAKILLPDSDSEHGASPVVDPGSPATKLVPQGRGNYQVLGEIARGGMGIVLKGHDTDLGRDVALKVLSVELAKDPAVVQRFVEEAQIGGQLQHPGIVPVYELGLMANDVPYFTMKLIKGRTLAALFQQRKTPGDNRGRLLAIFESVCQTVAYAHSRGVLHRDLKPANVMVGAFGEVQVVDWGLAKVMRRGGVADEVRAKDSLFTVIETVRSGPGSSGSNSVAGSVMGTPAYMSPEQAQGEVEKLDERADVFSLGAILCELLTGRPPYEELDGVVTVLQAARANLDPARARIQAAGVDPALSQLCLECLTPARTARPADADVVAKALREYLTSTEERAQKAELAALEARMKAADERRARRSTVVFAGTIVAVVLAGVGGLYWNHRETVRRADRIRDAVEAAEGESISLGQEGKHEDALAAARRALSLAEANDADAALLARTTAFVAKAELAVAADRRERELAQADATLLDRLQALQIERSEVELASSPMDPGRESRVDARFTQIFRDYGVDIDSDDLAPAMQRFRARGLGEELAFVFDDWGHLRRRIHGTHSKQVENLSYLAMDLDPDPLRLQVRQAIADNDLETMLRLGSPENLPNLQPRSIDTLATAIAERYPDHLGVAHRMAFQARELYPNDFFLQQACCLYYQSQGRLQDSLACAMAGLALRPNDPSARAYAVDALTLLGRLTDAEELARRGVAAAPGHARSRIVLGRVLLQLGDYAGAVENLSRGMELEKNPARASDLLVARFFAGSATKAELERGLAIESLLSGVATLMYGLLDHPDPALRDPAVVLRTMDSLSSQISREDWRFLIEAVARVRLGDWPAALSSIRDHISPWKVSEASPPLLMSPGAYDFFRATIFARVGRADAARECYERGMATWTDIAGSEPSTWDRSDVMRWRREAEAALAK